MAKKKYINASSFIGTRYGHLVCKELIRVDGRPHMLCVCDCGNTAMRALKSLRKGNESKPKSCGCAFIPANLRHGDSGAGRITPEYRIWGAIRQRCNNPHDSAFERYGGRGISVCERWDIFSTFLADMGRRPTAKHSIDRMDNNGNYEPSNCKWSTNTEQSRNKRNSHFLTYQGETLCMAAWEDRLGFKSGLIGARIYSGWSVERAITEPMKVI